MTAHEVSDLLELPDEDRLLSADMLNSHGVVLAWPGAPPNLQEGIVWNEYLYIETRLRSSW